MTTFNDVAVGFSGRLLEASNFGQPGAGGNVFLLGVGIIAPLQLELVVVLDRRRGQRPRPIESSEIVGRLLHDLPRLFLGLLDLDFRLGPVDVESSGFDAVVDVVFNCNKSAFLNPLRLSRLGN